MELVFRERLRELPRIGRQASRLVPHFLMFLNKQNVRQQRKRPQPRQSPPPLLPTLPLTHPPE